MKITNKSNPSLPEVIVRMAQAESEKHLPVEGTLSVTEICSAPRIYQLRKRHWDTLEEDVQDHIDMLFGTAWHRALEVHKGRDEIAEERYFCEVGSHKISGQVDLYDPATKTITDHKTAKVYSYMLGNHKDYEQQLNCYRYLLAKNDLAVEKIVIFWTFKDWSWRSAAKDEDYPQSKAMVQDIPLWTMDEAESFITTRLAGHFLTEELPDDELPNCLPEDMWEREPTFAVKKAGVQKAKRVLSSEKEAQDWIGNQKGLSIENRPGERVKCEQFCVLSKNNKCNQHRQYIEKNSAT